MLTTYSPNVRPITFRISDKGGVNGIRDQVFDCARSHLPPGPVSLFEPVA